MPVISPSSVAPTTNHQNVQRNKAFVCSHRMCSLHNQILQRATQQDHRHATFDKHTSACGDAPCRLLPEPKILAAITARPVSTASTALTRLAHPDPQRFFQHTGYPSLRHPKTILSCYTQPRTAGACLPQQQTCVFGLIYDLQLPPNIMVSIGSHSWSDGFGWDTLAKSRLN